MRIQFTLLCLPYTGLGVALRSLSSVALSSATSLVSVAQAGLRRQPVNTDQTEHLSWGIQTSDFEEFQTSIDNFPTHVGVNRDRGSDLPR